MLTCNRLLKEEDLTYMQFKHKYNGKPIDPKEEADALLKLHPIQKKMSTKKLSSHSVTMNEEKEVSQKEEDSERKSLSVVRIPLRHSLKPETPRKKTMPDRNEEKTP